MIELVRLSAKDAGYYWDAVTPLIIKCLERADGEYSLKDCQYYIENQCWDLWIAVNLDTKESETKAAGAGATDMDTLQSENNTLKIGKWKTKKCHLVLFDLSHVNTALLQHLSLIHI